MTTKAEILAKLGESINQLGDVTKTIGDAVQFIANAEAEKAPAQEAPVKEAPAKKAPAKKAPVVEEPVEEVDEVDEGVYTEAELKALKVPELKEILDEMGVEYKVKESKTNLIKLVLEAQDEEEEEIDELDEEEVDAEDEDGEEDLDDEEDEDDEDFLDLDAMTLVELRKLAKEEGIDVPKRVTKSALIEMIEDVLYDEDLDEDEDESDEESEIARLREEYGMADYEDDELRELLEDYDISSKGKRSALEYKFAKGLMDGTIPEEDFE